MSDDLGTILQSIATTQASILKRLDALERRDTESKGQADWGNRQQSEGLCRPTNPPSTSIQLERATFWLYFLDATNSDIAEISPWGWERDVYYPVGLGCDAFTNAYWYRWGIAGYSLSSGIYWLFDDATEYEQADQAIADFWGSLIYTVFDLYDDLPAYDGELLIPLCGLLFRNNGSTVGTGKVHPITLNDRNLSSFITRDLRPHIPLFYPW